MPKELGIDDQRVVLECVNVMLEVLKEVNRPFGYRVSDSIFAYVLTYPRNDDNWLCHAIADQVEQKILPKLIGLNPQDHKVKKASTLSAIRSNLMRS